MSQQPSDTLVLPVSGMTCAACVYHVSEALRSVDGVAEVSVNLATERATIKFSSGRAGSDGFGSGGPDAVSGAAGA